MKQFYSLLIGVITALSTTAQQYQLDSVVRTINDKQNIASQKNNINERLAEVVRFERDSRLSHIKYTAKTQMHYDDKGNYLKSISALWNSDNSNWEEASKAEWKYNDTEELIWTASYAKRSNDWLAEDQYERFISDDSIVEIDFRQHHDQLKPVKKSISLKNESDAVYHYETLIWNDTINEWEKSYLSKTFYVNDTTVVSRENYVWNENQWQGKDKEEYELDQNKEKTGNFTLYQGSLGGGWLPQSRFEETVFPEEKKTLSNTYRWSIEDQDWILYSQVQVFRNEEDQIQDVLFLELDTDSNKLVVHGEQLNLYDQHGRIKVVQEISHDGGTITGTQHSVKYDEDGNVDRDNHYELDAENHTWKEVSYTEFFFDKSVEWSTDKEQCVMDFYLLSEHNYASKKYAVKNVKIFDLENEQMVLSEEYDYFYSKKL